MRNTNNPDKNAPRNWAMTWMMTVVQDWEWGLSRLRETVTIGLRWPPDTLPDIKLPRKYASPHLKQIMNLISFLTQIIFSQNECAIKKIVRQSDNLYFASMMVIKVFCLLAFQKIPLTDTPTCKKIHSYVKLCTDSLEVHNFTWNCLNRYLPKMYWQIATTAPIGQSWLCCGPKTKKNQNKGSWNSCIATPK